MKFDITIKEIQTHTVTIEADSKEEALQQVEDMYYQGEYAFELGCFGADVDFICW